MKAITTRYRGATDTKGAAIIARTEGNRSARVSYDHALDATGNHEAAARELARRLGWSGELVAGCLPDGKTYAHVFTGAPSGFYTAKCDNCGGDGFVAGTTCQLCRAIGYRLRRYNRPQVVTKP